MQTQRDKATKRENVRRSWLELWRQQNTRPAKAGRGCLATAGALVPTLSVFFWREVLPPCLRRDELGSGSRQNTASRCAIAREIYGEKNNPVGAWFGQERKVPTGRDTQNALAPARSLHLPVAASFPVPPVYSVLVVNKRLMA